jgi:hypothetical protein
VHHYFVELRRTLAVTFTAAAAILMLVALFVPWQSKSFFGVDIEPGLRNVQIEGLGDQNSKPY